MGRILLTFYPDDISQKKEGNKSPRQEMRMNFACRDTDVKKKNIKGHKPLSGVPHFCFITTLSHEKHRATDMYLLLGVQKAKVTKLL